MTPWQPKTQCDGRCGAANVCRGTVKEFTVYTASGRKWGNYHYCELAAETTIKMGYLVLPVPKKKIN